MANQEHLNILAKGVKVWNDWRGQNADTEPNLGDANLGFAKLRDANLVGANLTDANLLEADLGDADLTGTNLTRANLRDADLGGANLHDAELSFAILRDANLRDAVVFSANLIGADLIGANLIGADLAYAKLRDAKLIGAKLVSANLFGSDLIGANLGDADLADAELRDADLGGADMSFANLHGADLGGANLIGADLGDADLRGADLRGANLGFANLRGALMLRTLFADVDLSTVKGLDTVQHEGPSVIGIDTIYKSKGNIPESFLRGAGVPESFIVFMKSLTGAAFDFYSCFISYSTKDQPFADRLHADLQARGIRCWFAPHDIQGGRKIHEQIDEAIRLYDKLLLILSPDSMSSNWVKTEIANARTKETQQGRQVLFPITLVPYEQIKAWKLFDADAGIDTAREVREYFVPDFSNWKDHDSYTRAFERLVRDLKAGPCEQ